MSEFTDVVHSGRKGRLLFLPVLMRLAAKVQLLDETGGHPFLWAPLHRSRKYHLG